MKKITILMTFVVALLFAAQAQKQQRYMVPEDKAGWMIEKMEKTMTLTPGQKTRLRTVFVNSFRKSDALREEFRKDRMQMQEAMRKNHEETNVALQEVLTPEQYKQFVAEKNDRQMQRMCKKGYKNHPPREKRQGRD